MKLIYPGEPPLTHPTGKRHTRRSSMAKAPEIL
jgi:hypothetical protein